MSRSSSSPAPFRLLDLPPELITKILIQCVLLPNSLPNSSQTSLQDQFSNNQPLHQQHHSGNSSGLTHGASQADPRPSPLLAPFPLPENHFLKPTISLSPHHLIGAGGPKHPAPLSLLLTNHRISAETHHLYYTLNSFSIVLHRDVTYIGYTSSGETFFSPSFYHTLRAIRSLEIRVHRWGTKDWFITHLIPALSQCILQGNLRILDIYMPARMATSLAQGTRLCGPLMKENVNFVALKELLKDVDLEEARLWAIRPKAWLGDGNIVHHPPGRFREPLKEGCWRKEQVSDMSWLLDRGAKGLEGYWMIETFADHVVKYRTR
ncbi:hypothetical protein EYC80_004351 [Monilinia laxa]|uniref:Uncharacterized protein n=1 Tax=Monilinia laxa TaxID=61186 RepID=A0A5N6KN42_MONLA|nr:hypothetical protein EYC80_004351 [Monilinia laxa]